MDVDGVVPSLPPRPLPDRGLPTERPPEPEPVPEPEQPPSDEGNGTMLDLYA
ncbi:MAG TPA: hypothetical protein PLQ29_08825 [Spirochaetales bacterium]|nr:hypothetical protein [Spirochaetales bacterium]HPG86788.1 hypothetical protein [Spirochaetales bacterium]HPM72759.1 hypothetical protein [Spirochaetales bacterium]